MAKKSVQNLFSTNRVNVLQENYFDIMPIHILIRIFNDLELADVMNCENISRHSQEAAANYYHRRFSTFHFNSDSLSSLACCSDNNHRSNLAFAKVMFRVIGQYVQKLYIRYNTFKTSWVRRLSKMIHKYCKNLIYVKITGKLDRRIKMLSTKNVNEMVIYKCLLDITPSWRVSSKLLCLRYVSNNTGSETDFLNIIFNNPYITDLTVYTTYLLTAQIRSIASVMLLKTLRLQIKQVDTARGLQMQESIDFPKLLKTFQMLPKLEHVDLIIPFYARLSQEIVDTSVKPLRHKCNVYLLAIVRHLEPEHIQSLRDDLDGLNGIKCNISVHQKDLLASLLTCERSEALHLLLRGQMDGLDQLQEVLAVLAKGVRKESCCLRILELCAHKTELMDVRHLPVICEILHGAKQLKVLKLLNCTPELIKRKAILNRHNVLVILR